MLDFALQTSSRIQAPVAVHRAKRIRTVLLRLAGAALALAATACDRTDYFPASSTYYKPWTGVIQVTRQPPTVYQQLGIVIAHGNSTATEDSLLQQLKDRAAGIGANVLIVTQDKTVTGHNLLGMPEYEMSGIAVRTVR